MAKHFQSEMLVVKEIGEQRLGAPLSEHSGSTLSPSVNEKEAKANINIRSRGLEVVYLYKYLFKGPDYVLYSEDDEI